MRELALFLALVGGVRSKVQRGDNFAVPAAPGGCSGTAEFLGCFKDDHWDPGNFGAKGVKLPAGKVAYRMLPYALPGCYNCKDGKTPDSKIKPNPCKFADNPPKCDREKMTDDYCAMLCLHWAAELPGGWMGKVWSATQFSYTCWCGTESDGVDTGAWMEANRVSDDQCITPCKGNADMMCGGPSLNHVMLVECTDWGGPLVLAVFLAALLYVSVGAVWVSQKQGVEFSRATLQGGELLPNRRFWRELTGLVIDGARFASNRFRRRRSAEAMQESLLAVERKSSVISAVPSGKSGKGGKGGKSSKASKAKKETGKKSGKRGQNDDSPGRSDDNSQSQPQPHQPRPTTMPADLGRRETDMRDAYGRVLRR